MLDLAIICSSFPAREHLLKRSLTTWIESMKHSGLNCSAYIYNNGISELEIFNPNPLQFKEYSIYCTEGQSGSHIAGYNYWMERVEAKKYLFTHPDILFPLETVRVAYEAAQPNTFAAFKVFWMPQVMTQEIEKYDWRHPEELETEVELYPKYSNEHGDFYWNGDVRSKTEWHSTTTFCIDSELAHMIYPMPDLSIQGYDDPLHHMIRSNSHVNDVCIMNPVLMHQWHEQSWNQDVGLAVTQAREMFHEHYVEKIKAWKEKYSEANSE